MRISQTLEAFVERMKGATTKLRSFKKAPLGYEIRVFGNTAAHGILGGCAKASPDAARAGLLVRTCGSSQTAA